VKTAKVKYTINQSYRRFGSDIETNETEKEALEATLEDMLRSENLSPVEAVKLQIKIRQLQVVIDGLKELRGQLFPNGIQE
jgi:hypothetical protein